MKANKGSQKWMQIVANDRPEVFASTMQKQHDWNRNVRIRWKSPLASDKYKEYTDSEFLEKLGVFRLPKRVLKTFWPDRGPVWDGLARTYRNDLLLVEAKSHILEMVSHCKAGEKSKKLIKQSLDETKRFLGVDSSTDWMVDHYQYANRLAHLYLLRELNELPAYLIFLYFVNDHVQKGPINQEEWEQGIDELHSKLGLPKAHKLSQYVLDVFIDVHELE
jgi:hypothetical protein